MVTPTTTTTTTTPTLLLSSDFILSFMWVWSSALIKLFIFNYLHLGLTPKAEILKASLSIASMFFFAWMGKITKGGSYNPLNLLSSATSGSFGGFLFTVGVRIPVQGSSHATWFLKLTTWNSYIDTRQRESQSEKDSSISAKASGSSSDSSKFVVNFSSASMDDVFKDDGAN